MSGASRFKWPHRVQVTSVWCHVQDTVQQFSRKGTQKMPLNSAWAGRGSSLLLKKMASTHCSCQTAQVYIQIQKVLLKTKRITQTLSCREVHNLKVPLGPEGRGRCHGCKCAQTDSLPFVQAATLYEELIRQHTIWESKQETDAWDYALTQAETVLL